MVVKRRSRNTRRTKKILNRSFRRTKSVRKKKYSRKSKRRKTRKTRNQRGGDTLDYYIPGQAGQLWHTGEINYNGDKSITVNGIQIICKEYEETFKPNGEFHSWAFLQPNGKYIYIRPRDPSDMTDLLTKWPC